MHYLIDGHNLIARIPDIDLADPDDEAQLILRLRRWTAVARNRRVTVIFDGGLPGGRAPHFSSAQIEVVFAPEHRDADRLLTRRISDVRNPREYLLVSSDRTVIAAAEARKMAHLTAEAFAERLDAELEARAQPDSLTQRQEEEPVLSEEEVAEWLELFGPVGESTASPSPSSPRRLSRRPAKARAQGGRGEQKPRQPARRADELKESGEELTEDEVQAWLDLFADDETGEG